MSKEEARYFAGLMEFYLYIPSFVCENIEKKLIDENYKEVIEFIINRTKELKEKQKDIKYKTEIAYKTIENIRKIAREENKPFIDRIMELQDTLKDREEYCYGLEQNLNKQQEVLDKIKEYIKEELSQGGPSELKDLVNGDYILELLEEIE